MVKQKVVIKLSMENARRRTKALTAAAGMDGITSASINGDSIVVEGDGFDLVALTTVLRKKLGHANLITVTTDDGKKKDKNENPVVLPYYYAVNSAYPYQYQYVYPEARYPDSCSIM